MVKKISLSKKNLIQYLIYTLYIFSLFSFVCCMEQYKIIHSNSSDCQLTYKLGESIFIDQIDNEINFRGKLIINDNVSKNFEVSTVRDNPEIKIESDLNIQDDDSLTFSILEPYSFHNLILINNKFPECKFDLKRKEEGILGYDFRVQFRGRKDSLNYGIEVKYGNKKEYDNLTKKHYTYLMYEGDKKDGKTYSTGTLCNRTTDISPDDTMNTNGMAGVICHRLVAIDTEGLDTPLASKKFFNVSNTEEDLEEVKIEMEKNKIFREIIRDSFRDIAKIHILIVNQNTVQVREYINSFIEKLKFEKKKKKFIVLHNYKELEIADLRERVNKDILFNRELKEIILSEQPLVKAYLDEDYEGSGVEVIHTVLLNKDKESFFNQITFNYISEISKGRESKLNPVQEFVKNLNRRIQDELDEGFSENMNCVKLEKVDEVTDLITFINQDKCDIWKNVKTFNMDYQSEIYMQNSLLYVNIFLPGLLTQNDIESKFVEIKKRDKNNFSLIVEIILNKNYFKGNQNESSSRRIDFLKIKRKNEVNIKHDFHFIGQRGWSFINDHEMIIRAGVISLSFPYSFNN